MKGSVNVKLNLIRNEYPFFKHNPDLIYFDNAATALKPQCVIDVLTNYYEKESVNVHRGAYPLADCVNKQYEKARDQVANFIGANADEIIFTSGTTNGMNQLAYALLPNLNDGDVILTTKAEHASSILPFIKLMQLKDIKVEYIELDEKGHFNLNSLKKALHKKVKAVVLAEIGNVLGYHLPIKEIVELVHAEHALLFVDGAQSIAHVPVDVKDTQVDAFAFSAHKLGATTGCGALYIKKDLQQYLSPSFYGGTSNCYFDENGKVVLCKGSSGYEAGTPPIEGAIALGRICTFYQTVGMEQIQLQEQKLRDYLFQGLKKINHITVLNEDSDIAMASFIIDQIHPQDAAAYFAKHHICLRSGQHCARLLKQVIPADATLRVSLSFYNTFEEIDQFLNVCSSITLEKCFDLYI